jgi:hypothetical protein
MSRWDQFGLVVALGNTLFAARDLAAGKSGDAVLGFAIAATLVLFIPTQRKATKGAA